MLMMVLSLPLILLPLVVADNDVAHAIAPTGTDDNADVASYIIVDDNDDDDDDYDNDDYYGDVTLVVHPF